MAKKQKHTTIASFNYLNEISAFPAITRNEYLQKLLKRKNSGNQLNTQLLKIIYSFIDKNEISRWNPEEICRLLNITGNSLYIHKSRLLSGLREYYLNWKKIEREIEKETQYHDDPLQLELEKALKMFDIGMIRESKNKMLRLEKKLAQPHITLKNKYSMLVQVYEKLIMYNNIKSNRNKVIYYLEKIINIKKLAASGITGFSKKEMILLDLRLNLCKFLKDSNHGYKKRLIHAKSYINKAVKYAIQIEHTEYILRTQLNTVIAELMTGNMEKALEHSVKGFNLSVKLKVKEARYNFAGMIYITKKSMNENISDSGFLKIIEFYYKLKTEKPLNFWTTNLENICVNTYYPEKKKEILDIFYERINSNFLKGDLSYSVYWRFILNMELFDNNILTYFVKNNIPPEDFPLLKKIHEKIINDTENLCINTLACYKELNNIGFIWDVYKLQLKAIFFREETFDYESALLIINKMEWLKKKKRNVSSLNTFELLKLSVQMLEHADHHKYLLYKYEHKFNKFISSLKSHQQKFNITDYAVISSLARRLRCREITAIVKDLYHWLEANHPEILAPALREIEERASKVKLIDGSKQSAA